MDARIRRKLDRLIDAQSAADHALILAINTHGYGSAESNAARNAVMEATRRIDAHYEQYGCELDADSISYLESMGHYV